jgi:aerobic-type carbon monoxide dehydrogenase small subunit (CoxS/CutS family)
MMVCCWFASFKAVNHERPSSSDKRICSEFEKLSRNEIREHISGNMCRCTGYHAIVDAIEAVLAKGSR